MNLRMLPYRLQCIRAQAPKLLQRLRCAVSGHRWVSTWFPLDLQRHAETDVHCHRCDELIKLWAWPPVTLVQLPLQDGRREMIKAPWRPE